MPTKNFRKRTLEQDPDPTDANDDEEEESRSALEEVKLLQKLRERKLGTPALTASHSTPAVPGGPLKRPGDKGDTGDGEEELVLQDTFAQETAVTIEDPNMLKYVEHELAKRKGKNVDAGDNEDKDPVDELYVIPEHLKVKKRNSEESSTQWTTGIAEVQLPIEYKLRNIEETEAAKKLLQEKRLAGRTKSELSIPSSFSADYFQRGRDYAEKLRRGTLRLELRAYADADWASDPTTRKSITGFCIYLGDLLISWKYKKQKQTRFHSSTGAVYRAMSSTTKELVYLRRLLGDMGALHRLFTATIKAPSI